MKTTRTRMLIVFITAAIIISFFVRWDDFSRGFHQGRNEEAHSVAN